MLTLQSRPSLVVVTPQIDRRRQTTTKIRQSNDLQVNNRSPSIGVSMPPSAICRTWRRRISASDASPRIGSPVCCAPTIRSMPIVSASRIFSRWSMWSWRQAAAVRKWSSVFSSDVASSGRSRFGSPIFSASRSSSRRRISSPRCRGQWRGTLRRCRHGSRLRCRRSMSLASS